MRNQDKILSHFNQYLRQEGASIRTQKNYLFDVHDFLLWNDETIQEPNLLATTTSDIHHYIQNLQSKGKSVSTINRKLSSLRMLFASLEQSRMLMTNPMQGVSNLDLDQELIPHKPLLQAYEANLKHAGIHQSELMHHKTIVTDFLRWVSRKTPT